MIKLLAIALTAVLISPQEAEVADGQKEKTVYVDYRGACGGSLVETRRRQSIERQTKKVVRRLVGEGYAVRLIVRDGSVAYGNFMIASGPRWATRIPVFNRNFSCGY